MKGYHKIAKTPAIKCSHFINFEIVKTKLAGLRMTRNGKQIVFKVSPCKGLFGDGLKGHIPIG